MDDELDITTADDTAAGDRESEWARFSKLPDTCKAVAHDRLKAVQEVELLQSCGVKKDAAVDGVAIKHQKKKVTIYRWLELVKDVARCDRLAYLAPRQHRRPPTLTVTEYLAGAPHLWTRETFLSVVETIFEIEPEICADELRRRLAAKAVPLGYTVPSLRRCQDLVSDNQRYWERIRQEGKARLRAQGLPDDL